MLVKRHAATYAERPGEYGKPLGDTRIDKKLPKLDQTAKQYPDECGLPVIGEIGTYNTNKQDTKRRRQNHFRDRLEAQEHDPWRIASNEPAPGV